jgi:hypothetical protein
MLDKGGVAIVMMFSGEEVGWGCYMRSVIKNSNHLGKKYLRKKPKIS